MFDGDGLFYLTGLNELDDLDLDFSAPIRSSEYANAQSQRKSSYACRVRCMLPKEA